ncbi:MAG: type II toxin-antitoxin system RelE/ParE family toxin [Nitrospinales bacterium]
MADYELSNKADEDLSEIYIFSHRRFGESRAAAYLQALEERFLMLAERPLLGRRIDHIHKAYFRFEYASHSIFYKLKKGGIFVVRVLHQSMDPERHV